MIRSGYAIDSKTLKVYIQFKVRLALDFEKTKVTKGQATIFNKVSNIIDNFMQKKIRSYKNISKIIIFLLTTIKKENLEKTFMLKCQYAKLL